MLHIFTYRLFPIGLSLILTSLSVCAQTGKVTGRILSDSLNSLELASVYLKGTSFGTYSDVRGAYTIPSVPAGHYTLVVSHINFDTYEMPLVLSPGQTLEISPSLKISEHQSEEVVITATRTEKDVQDLPIPVTVVSEAQIRQMGSMRLTEVLQEQTGIAVTNDDHGTGVQIQGFSSDYTLILVDGDPLIGRTAGTLDLNRITIGNIKQIEIVKGPSSSLYGSEALAGVINIITQQPKDKAGMGLRARYGSNQTADLSADGYIHSGKWKYYAFANRYSTAGYDLSPSTEDKTVPPYHNYTLQQKISYALNPKLNISLSARGFYEDQNSIINFAENGTSYRVQQVGKQYDWNVLPQIHYQINNRNAITLKTYATFYHTNAVMNNTSDGSLYDDSYFNQHFTRPEFQYARTWNRRNQTIAGIGVTLESVNSTRYSEPHYFNSTFVYAQHDWTPVDRINIIAGARYDAHSVYGNQLSPKLSMKYKVSKKITLRASAGSGFKAPDFRQLYLNFTNPVVGYSVFGTEEVQAQIATLQQQGLIAQVYTNPSSQAPLKAERSVAFNVGGSVAITKKMNVQINFFRNDINDMIETSAYALKTNGQQVFSYHNLNRVFTQGIEANASYTVLHSLTLSAGYQYLEAKNKEVLDDIKNGEYYSRNPTTYVTRQLKVSDYGGLFNRSKHMFNAKVFYMDKKSGWMASVRAIYRGKYGSAVLDNGNGILDAPDEYVPGYWLCNASAGKTIKSFFTLQAGVDNVLDYTNPTFIQSIPGRIYYVSVYVKWNK